MELLQRMAKADARVGVRRAGGAWRSMDSLDAVEVRARSLPRPASTSASQHLAQSSEALDGPRSLDLDLDREGVVGVAAFTLQSWDERGSTRPWSPPLTTSAALLSPRQWRPLSAGTASTASTRAMSEFIRESYSSSGPAEPPAAQEAVTAQADAAEADGSKALPGQKALDAPEAADQPIARAASPAAPTVTEGLDTSDTRDAETRPLTSSPASPGTASAKRADLLDVAVADGRPGSAASSTTESLGELENDIMHMLSTSGSASTRAGAEEEDGAKDGEGREEAAAVPASMLQQHRDAAKDAVPVPLST
ncbi:endochitinase A1-like [Thrips palmi]|uniref:Endochitinase A1-like n=1 Tax=Thrips palmi TaxID=161013 RepID=A0A6P9AAQ4_THRPL|nr:endochitinase A1-like [Thrips palmi]